MKRLKLSSSIAMLILTLACLTFGVYSAVKTTFTASGTITFNAYGLELDVKCTITGLKDGVTKTLYGTTFLTSSNASGADRTNYVSSSAILSDATHFNLSSSGATMTLGELAFDELSEDVNKIEIKFEFYNYSDYIVKAEANVTVGAEDKLIYTPGGAAIMNKYTETETTQSDYGWFPIQIFTKAGATAISSSENSLSIAITVSPEGLTLSDDGKILYDTTVVEEGAEDNEYNRNGLMYGVKSGFVGCVDVESEDESDPSSGVASTPKFKSTINLATTVLGVDMKEVYISEYYFQPGYFYSSNIKKLSLPAKLTNVSTGGLSGLNISSIILPNTLNTIDNYGFGICSKLTNIIYNGTIEEWNNNTSLSGYGWSTDTGANTIYCTDGEVSLG